MTTTVKSRKVPRASGARPGPTTDAVEILRRQLITSPKAAAEFEAVRLDASVARQVYALRTRAGLTQKQLAKLVGTTPSAICRLEDADYQGHSLSMLRRIAAALGHRIALDFVPLDAPDGVR